MYFYWRIFVENYRKSCIADFVFDPCHYYALPGFTFDACLKCTDQELDLFTDSEVFRFIDHLITGEVNVVRYRYTKVNNPIIPDYDNND